MILGKMARGTTKTGRTAGKAGKTRVIIVDDHEIVIRGLRRVIELDGRVAVVGSAGTVAEGQELCRYAMPEAIILDLRLPDSDETKIVSQFREICPESKIIVLTAYGNVAKDQAIHQGADAFLTKEMASEKIADVVCGLFSSKKSTSRRVEPLSPREQKVAHLVSMGMSNEEVGTALNISTNTVKTHFRRVLSKLGLRDRVQLAAEWRNRKV